MRSKDDLRILQALPLDVKVWKTEQRLREFVNYFGVDGVRIAVSGGKDSTVLWDIATRLFPEITGLFVDTGLEYPEIRQFVKTLGNIEVVRPKMRFDEVLKTYGYPVISKEVANCIYWAKRGNQSRVARLNGTWKNADGEKSIYNKEKYKPLLAVDFNITDRCCDVMKKQPSHKVGKAQIVATMAEESLLRYSAWIKTGCNAFEQGKSTPMAFWTEQDVLKYIKERNLPIASVYGEILYKCADGGLYEECLCDGKLCTTGAKRTGCIFCMFGAHRSDDDRFLQLKETHPRQYEYCMGGGEYVNGVWQPNKQGLGMGHVIDTLNKIYGKDFIKY